MKRFSIRLILIILLFQFSCQSESKFIPKSETIRLKIQNNLRLHNQFEIINWKDSLTQEDKNLILVTLDSSRGYTAPNIMIPSLIHRLNIFNERKNISTRDGSDRELFELTENMSDKEFDKQLYSLIIPECLVKNLEQKITHYHCKGDDYLNVLVIRQCKLLRKGQESNIDIPDSLLNKRQEYLLEYSKLESHIAIEKLHELAKLYDTKNNTYHGQISMTLSSYGRNATFKTLSVFMDKRLLSEYSSFGKSIIVKHLNFRSIVDLNNDEIRELWDRINSINIQDEKLEKAKYEINRLKTLIEI